VQSEYGWADSVVLDTPVCRLRQIVANIEDRLKAHRLRQEQIEEWHVRSLAQVIVSSSMADPKSKKALMGEVSKLSLQMTSADSDKPTSPADVPPEVFIEQGSQVADNPNGSIERHRQAFGAR
jgi:hypothetical protein